MGDVAGKPIENRISGGSIGALDLDTARKIKISSGL